MEERKASLLIYLGEVSKILSLLVMIMVIARLGSPEELGLFNFSLALIAPVFMFLWMQQRTVLASDAEHRYSTGEYFSVRAVAVIIAIIITALLGYSFSRQTHLAAFFALVFIKSLESFSDLTNAVFLRSNQIYLIARFKLSRAISMSLCFYLAFQNYSSLSLALFCASIVSAIILWLELKLAFRIETDGSDSSTRSRFSNIFSIFRETYSLGTLELLYTLNGNMPKYLLMYAYGEVIVGIYSSLTYLLRPAVLFVTSMFQALTRKISILHIDRNESELKRLLKRMIFVSVLISTLLTIFFVIFGDRLIVGLFGDSFDDQGNLLVLISLYNFAALPAGMISYYGIIRRRFRLQPYVLIVTIVTSILFSIIFLAKFEEIGVILGWIASSIVLLIGQSLLLTGLSKNYQN